MKTLIRLGAILAGYVLAFLVAWAAVALYVAATDSPERQAGAGMASFGDAFLFLVVFGLAALPSTAVALWALRPSRRFWAVLKFVVLGVAITALVTLLGYLGGRTEFAHPWLQSLAMLAPMRMLFAPPLGLLFAMSAVCAPDRSSRITLAIATLIEAAAFLSFVAILFGSVQ
jgi:hypothetical protein